MKFSDNLDINTVRRYHKELFVTQPEISINQGTKQQAIKIAISTFYAILENPRICIKYLEKLNSEFKQYYANLGTKEPFPEVKAYDLLFYKLQHTVYPVPLSVDYTSNIKHKWFKQFLIHKLRSKGLAGKIFKWHGIVPHEVSIEMLKNGNAMFENRYFPMIIFHGREAHMIQYCMLSAIIENNDINTHYTQDGQIHHLQPREIIDAMLELKIGVDTLWAYILDKQTGIFTFCDPFQLTSFMMVSRSSFDISAISDALIDDTLKSILKLHQIFKQHIPGLLNPVSFMLQLSEIPLSHNFMPEFLFNHVVKKHQQPNLKYQGFFHSFKSRNYAYTYYEKPVEPAPIVHTL
jgi:hypothetical protein